MCFLFSKLDVQETNMTCALFSLELLALYLAYCLTVSGPLDMPQVSILNIKTEKVKFEKKSL